MNLNFTESNYWRFYRERRKTKNIAVNIQLSEQSIIEDDVIIDEDVEIGHHVMTRNGVRIGHGCKILDGVILGKCPAKASLNVCATDKSINCFL